MNRRHKFVDGDSSEGQRRAQREEHPNIPEPAKGRWKEAIKDSAEGKKWAEKERAAEESRGSQDFGLSV